MPKQNLKLMDFNCNDCCYDCNSCPKKDTEEIDDMYDKVDYIINHSDDV